MNVVVNPKLNEKYEDCLEIVVDDKSTVYSNEEGKLKVLELKDSSSVATITVNRHLSEGNIHMDLFLFYEFCSIFKSGGFATWTIEWKNESFKEEIIEEEIIEEAGVSLIDTVLVNDEFYSVDQLGQLVPGGRTNVYNIAKRYNWQRINKLYKKSDVDRYLKARFRRDVLVGAESTGYHLIEEERKDTICPKCGQFAVHHNEKIYCIGGCKVSNPSIKLESSGYEPGMTYVEACQYLEDKGEASPRQVHPDVPAEEIRWDTPENIESDPSILKDYEDNDINLAWYWAG